MGKRSVITGMDVLSFVCKLCLSVVFLFSGFVKALDPMGGAIKLGEYAASVSVNMPFQVYLVGSILLAVFEFGLGLALLFKVHYRLSTWLVMMMMTFFTVLTLCIAIWNPVPDCGCFGDAVKLTNVQTFYKNLFLLPMSIFLFFMSTKRVVVRDRRLDYTFLVICFLAAVPLSAYALRHVPIIDFMPFKVGVNIPEAMVVEGEVHTTLIYRNIQTDKLEEFSLEDTEWYDTLKYEFVDTKIIQDNLPEIAEFSLYLDDENIGYDVLDGSKVVLVMGPIYTQANPEAIQNVERLLAQADGDGYQSYYVSSEDISSSTMELGEFTLPSVFIDGVTRKMLLRANFGVVVLHQGTIVAKWNGRDIPPVFTQRLRDVKN
ncbi:MAG: DoxX family protein [Rikenellaceae bacterium]